MRPPPHWAAAKADEQGGDAAPRPAPPNYVTQEWRPPSAPATPSDLVPRQPCAQSDPLRQAFFGDLHTHTAFSLDALKRRHEVHQIPLRDCCLPAARSLGRRARIYGKPVDRGLPASGPGNAGVSPASGAMPQSGEAGPVEPERHKETLDLLSRPEWVEAIARGKEEVAAGVPGKSLDELAD